MYEMKSLTLNDKKYDSFVDKTAREEIKTLKENGVSQEQIDTAVNTALEQAKESGAFDGPPGEPGKDGNPGKDGQDGKTPVVGVDYYTEADKEEMVNAVLSALPNGEGVRY